MKIRAPAKINIQLRVLGKRADGYHLIHSIMVPISLYDELEIRAVRLSAMARQRRHGSIEVACDHPLVPSGRKNLAYHAAAAILSAHGVDADVSIYIRKTIPVGAGLGGGSSDAAATLIGLNRLFKLDLSSTQLKRLAARLGADVPFFIEPGAKRARGIGERLVSLPQFPRMWAVVLYPRLPVSTRWVYGHYRGTLTKPSVNTSISSSLRSSSNFAAVMINDLEPVTVRRYPVIKRLKEQLAQTGAIGTLMSGSGSSVFGLFETKRDAQTAFRKVRSKGRRGAQAFLVRLLG